MKNKDNSRKWMWWFLGVVAALQLYFVRELLAAFALFAVAFTAIAFVIASLYMLQRGWVVAVGRIADSKHPVMVAARQGIGTIPGGRCGARVPNRPANRGHNFLAFRQGIHRSGLTCLLQVDPAAVTRERGRRPTGLQTVGLFSFLVNLPCPADSQFIGIEPHKLHIPKAAVAKIIGLRKAQIENAGGESFSTKNQSDDQKPVLLFAASRREKMIRCKVFALAAAWAATLAIVSVGAARAQERAQPPAPKKVAIRAGRLIDGKSETPMANALILIEGDKIVSVTPGGSAPAGVQLIDLSRATVLPGFVDTHTHILLQGDITEEEYDAQLLKESIPYRAILAARNARIALEHGFTTIRDLETEGAMYADVDVKKAIANGEVPGPRLQVATRAMTPTGMYPLLGYSWELKVPTGVQYVDGADGARKAVREQVMYGADWIKYYSDRRYHFEADGALHSMVNFTDEEAKAIVDETASPLHFAPAWTPSNTATA